MSEDTVQRLMELADEYGRWVPDLCMGGLYRGIATQRRAEARSTLESALREALMPAGWKLVPVEPTDEMWDAAENASMACELSLDRPGYMDDDMRAFPTARIWMLVCAYRAMLSAAPSAFPVELEQPEQPLGDAASGAALSVAGSLPSLSQRADTER